MSHVEFGMQKVKCEMRMSGVQVPAEPFLIHHSSSLIFGSGA